MRIPVFGLGTKRENLANNLPAQQLTLSEQDMVDIAALECNGSLVPNWD